VGKSSDSHDIKELLRKWSAENPRELNPRGPLLLAKPQYYDVVRNSPGLTLVKGLFGSGKTYGFGLSLFHDARKNQDLDVIYINLRTVIEKYPRYLSSLKNITDLISAVCAGTKIPPSEQPGVFMTTNISKIFDVCKGSDKYFQKSSNPIESFSQFLIDVAQAYDKRVILVFDEFEGMSELMTRKAKEDLYDLILSTIRSLRPGVMEQHPGKLALIYLIQEVVYPSARLKELINREGQTLAALGRLFALGEDGSIPVRYTRESFIEYIDKALSLLREKSIINEDIYRQLIEQFSSEKEKIKSMISLLSTMPAFHAFQLLNLTIANSIEDALRGKPVYPRRILESLLELPSNSMYKIYLGKRPFTSSQLANSLSQLLSRVLALTGERDVIAVAVKRTGYEGAYYITPTNTYILIIKTRDPEDEKRFRKRFVSAYRRALENCKSDRKDEKKCILILLHYYDVNVPLIQLAIRDIDRELAVRLEKESARAKQKKQQKDGRKINIVLVPIKVGYDDVFNLIVAFNDVMTPAGTKEHIIREKVSELAMKIKEELIEIGLA